MSANSFALAGRRPIDLYQMQSLFEPLIGPVNVCEKYVIVIDRSLSSQKVVDAVKRLGFALISSCNRVEHRICFTVVPYAPATFFAKDLIEAPKGLTDDAVWDVIAEIKSLYKEGDPVYTDDGKKCFQNQDEFWGWFASSREETLSVVPIVLDALEKSPRSGRALDIGCGKGSEAIELATRGWKVSVVDSSSKALMEFNRIRSGIKGCESIHVVCSDICEFTFSEAAYDFVVANNVLQYINFSKIQSIFEGITKSLSPGGMFVGSLRFQIPDDPMVDVFRRRGVSFLPEPGIAVVMLRSVGLKVEVVRYRYSLLDTDSYPHSEVVDFIARKS